METLIEKELANWRSSSSGERFSFSADTVARGAIPPESRPMLERVGLRGGSWIDCVTNFGRWFHRAAGRMSLLTDAAARAGRRWFHGASRCRQAFA